MILIPESGYDVVKSQGHLGNAGLDYMLVFSREIYINSVGTTTAKLAPKRPLSFSLYGVANTIVPSMTLQYKRLVRLSKAPCLNKKLNNKYKL